MADVITENDDDLEIVEVEKIPTPAEIAAKAAESEDEKDDESHEDEEDARLVADEDEEDDATGTPAEKKKRRDTRTRAQRNADRRRAEERSKAEIVRLTEHSTALERRLAAVEGNVLTQSESQIDTRLTKTREDINLADSIMEKALEAGNGADFIAAQNMRDAAKAAEFELLRDKGSVTKTRENAPDPAIARLSGEWKAANAGWYGADQGATQVANQIDGQVAADGYDPKTPAYWQELSRRLQARFKPAEDAPTSKKKTPPPQGQSREHVPPSTRREVYVTPERKQAMVDAGIWDDIPRRTKMLKAYADFDRDQSAS